MQLKNLLTDDDAVSPVIGVILMVAITVILAAVIGAFVLDLGGGQDTAPSVTWEYDYVENGANDEVTVAHNGGDQVKRSALTISVGGTTAYENGAVTTAFQGTGYSNDFQTTLSAGQSVTLVSNGNDIDDTKLQVIWASPDTGTTSVVGSYTTPS